MSDAAAFVPVNLRSLGISQDGLPPQGHAAGAPVFHWSQVLHSHKQVSILKSDMMGTRKGKTREGKP